MPLAGLEADSAGVEGDAFTDQRVGLFALPAAVVLHHDDAAGLGAALGDGEKRACAQLAQLLLVEHLDLQPLERLAQLPGLVRHVVRVADVRWQVAQVTSEAHAGGYRRGVADRLFNLRLVGLVAEQGDLAEFGGVVLFALELLEQVLTVDQHFDQHAGPRIGVTVFDLHILHGEGRIATAKTLDDAERSARRLAPLARIELARLAGADEQDAFGFEAWHAVQ